MRRSLFILTLSFATIGELRAAAPAGIVPPNAPKSVFVDEPGFGRDPFFPNSIDRRVVTQVDTTVTATVPVFITCKGISQAPGKKPLAIINNYTLAEGEEFSLRYSSQVTKVKVVQIKERSVIVEVNGVSKELPLRTGFN
jgi:hypothetical protein